MGRTSSQRLVLSERRKDPHLCFLLGDWLTSIKQLLRENDLHFLKLRGLQEHSYWGLVIVWRFLKVINAFDNTAKRNLNVVCPGIRWGQFSTQPHFLQPSKTIDKENRDRHICSIDAMYKIGNYWELIAYHRKLNPLCWPKWVGNPKKKVCVCVCVCMCVCVCIHMERERADSLSFTVQTNTTL